MFAYDDDSRCIYMNGLYPSLLECEQVAMMTSDTDNYIKVTRVGSGDTCFLHGFFMVSQRVVVERRSTSDREFFFYYYYLFIYFFIRNKR